jgi:hypothetical protein
MDTIKNQFNISIFKNLNRKYFDPAISHLNKWKDGIKSLGESFPGSSTIFVWLTDFWHLLKAIGLILISVGFLLTPLKICDSYYCTFIFYLLIYFIIFELTLKIIKKS